MELHLIIPFIFILLSFFYFLWNVESSQFLRRTFAKISIAVHAYRLLIFECLPPTALFVLFHTFLLKSSLTKRSSSEIITIKYMTIPLLTKWITKEGTSFVNYNQPLLNTFPSPWVSWFVVLILSKSNLFKLNYIHLVFWTTSSFQPTKTMLLKI